MGPKTPASTVLSSDEEAVIVAFRNHMLLPLDDCLHALQSTAPNLTRSSPYRCLQRHDIGRLPDPDALRKGRRQARQETLQSLSHRLGWLLGPVESQAQREGQPGDCHRLPGSLKSRKMPQNTQKPHTLRVHLQSLDRKTGTVHHRSDKHNRGAEELGSDFVDLVGY